MFFFFLKHVNTHTHSPSEIGRKFCRKLHCSGFDCSLSPLQGAGKLGFEDTNLNGMLWACGLWGHFGALRGSWQKKNSPQVQGVARVPARKEPNLSVCTKNSQLLSYSTVLGQSHWDPRRQCQSEVFSLKDSGGKLCSDWLVGLVEKDAPLTFINVMPATRTETGWRGSLFISNVQYSRYLEQFSLKMVQRWGNQVEIIPLCPLRKNASYILRASFLRC